MKITDEGKKLVRLAAEVDGIEAERAVREAGVVSELVESVATVRTLRMLAPRGVTLVVDDIGWWTARVGERGKCGEVSGYGETIGEAVQRLAEAALGGTD